MLRHILRSLGLALALHAPASTALPEPVDLVLILATDVSNSIDAGEYLVQKRGIIDALRDPKVARAVVNCAPGGVALSYAEWSGEGQFTAVVDWRKINGPAAMDEFAAAMARAPRTFDGPTDLDFALQSSLAAIRRAPFVARRRVIDVSTDGVQNVENRLRNQAPFPKAGGIHDQLGRTRDRVVAEGVVINGLVIAVTPPTDLPRSSSSLDVYVQTHVIGGSKSFTETISTFDQMHAAFRDKLAREICGDTVTMLR